jgi:hypothetical protein
MMLPRAGGRDFSDVKKIVTKIYERNVEAWEADNRTFGAAKPAKKRAPPATKKKAAKTMKKKMTKKASRKR